MPTSPAPKSSEPGTHQAEQQKLVKQALETPGVAAAIEVYTALQPYVARTTATRTAVRFSTGGNS
jgi:hypothetical protein